MIFTTLLLNDQVWGIFTFYHIVHSVTPIQGPGNCLQLLKEPLVSGGILTDPLWEFWPDSVYLYFTEVRPLDFRKTLL